MRGHFASYCLQFPLVLLRPYSRRVGAEKRRSPPLSPPPVLGSLLSGIVPVGRGQHSHRLYAPASKREGDALSLSRRRAQYFLVIFLETPTPPPCPAHTPAPTQRHTFGEWGCMPVTALMEVERKPRWISYTSSTCNPLVFSPRLGGSRWQRAGEASGGSSRGSDPVILLPNETRSRKVACYCFPSLERFLSFLFRHLCSGNSFRSYRQSPTYPPDANYLWKGENCIYFSHRVK